MFGVEDSIKRALNLVILGKAQRLDELETQIKIEKGTDAALTKDYLDSVNADREGFDVSWKTVNQPYQFNADERTRFTQQTNRRGRSRHAEYTRGELEGIGNGSLVEGRRLVINFLKREEVTAGEERPLVR